MTTVCRKPFTYDSVSWRCAKITATTAAATRSRPTQCSAARRGCSCGVGPGRARRGEDGHGQERCEDRALPVLVVPGQRSDHRREVDRERQHPRPKAAGAPGRPGFLRGQGRRCGPGWNRPADATPCGETVALGPALLTSCAASTPRRAVWAQPPFWRAAYHRVGAFRLLNAGLPAGSVPRGFRDGGSSVLASPRSWPPASVTASSAPSLLLSTGQPTRPKPSPVTLGI